MPVVGNTHDLQTKPSDIGAWFLRAATKVNGRIAAGNTAQGFYIFGADGSAFGFNNNRSVERVLGFLNRGIEVFRASPPSPVEIEPFTNPHPQAPPRTTVLRVYSRIHPVPDGSHTANENVQRDHLWLLDGEVAMLREGKWPDTFARRLLRFALVDAVRGEPDFWTGAEVREYSFRVARDGNAKLLVNGRFKMSTHDSSRGMEGRLDAEILLGESDVQRFIAVAECIAWGHGRWTPNPPPGRFPIRFAIQCAPEAAHPVAPQAAMYGREYLTP